MTSRRRVPLRVGLAVGMITAVGIGAVGVHAANALPPTIAGQATNFDVRNDTDKECEGFEVDIEDISATDVTYTWPGNSAYVNPFGSAKTITNTTFPDGHSGVVVKMQANYVGGAWDAFTPVGQLNHFGVHVNGAPGVTTYSWLCDSGTDHAAGSTGSLVPYGGTTTGNYYPQPLAPAVVPTIVQTPSGPVVEARVVPAQVPEPIEVEPRLPDAVFIKRYEISSPNVVDVNNLLVTNPEVQRAMTQGIINDAPELFQPDPLTNGGEETEPADPIGNNDASSLVVTETYSYTGPVDPADNSATCTDVVGDPNNCQNFVGPMIGRQMASTLLRNVPQNTMSASLMVGKVATPGAGNITSVPLPGNADPEALDCGSDAGACSTSLDRGTQIALTATPNTGYDFVKWTGACTGTTPTCTVTVSANKAATAVFGSSPKLSVAISKYGHVVSDITGIDCSRSKGVPGYGGTCKAPFHKNSVVVLTAIAPAGKSFVGWTGSCTSTLGPTCTVSITGNAAVAAKFGS